ncbi:60S ribosomal protein L6 [Culex quinquefasciatus]|uniref:60S ribosomal protein L6 n=1 Tax=Culex quinquefasciatus TaxID=7176 RepID=B0X141_CULQU|nr:60S ribosomal protein L6 [Culex quinquefasciatus]|eukprot:XP_001863363.1 60S ribosomal protein L6 [Culex quinquefasciatus]
MVPAKKKAAVALESPNPSKPVVTKRRNARAARTRCWPRDCVFYEGQVQRPEGALLAEDPEDGPDEEAQAVLPEPYALYPQDVEEGADCVTGKARRLADTMKSGLLLVASLAQPPGSACKKKSTCTEKNIFAEKEVKYVPSEQRKADQKTVGDGVLNATKTHPEVTTFSMISSVSAQWSLPASKSRTIFNSGAESAIIVKKVPLSVQPYQTGAGLAYTVTEGRRLAARKSSYARSTSGSGILPAAATTAISRFLTAKIHRRPRCRRSTAASRHRRPRFHSRNNSLTL